MFEQGLIPPDQWTEEEKMLMQQRMQAGDQPDPMTVILEQQQMIEAFKTEQEAMQKDRDLQIKEREQDRKEMETMAKAIEGISKMINTDADTLHKLREAMGDVTVVGPDVAQAYSEQAEYLSETIDNRENL